MEKDKEFERSRSEADEPLREGEVLGLGGIVPKSPSDPVTEFDDDSVAQRRARVRESEESEGGTGIPRGSGATGIDMGAGGEGTDIE